MCNKKPQYFIFFMMTFVAGFSFAQDITTAADLFKLASATYEGVRDYTAKVSIQQKDETMVGLLSFKNPNLFRIDFTQPSKQVFVSDGKVLQIYLPKYSVTFNQQLRKSDDTTPLALATGQGLKLLKNGYSIGYLNGPEMEVLDSASGEKVFKLKLTSATELYRVMEISIQKIDNTYFIRRIIGTTVGYNTVQLDFQDMKFNQDIPESKFQFDSPPSANTVRNFLFEPEG